MKRWFHSFLTSYVAVLSAGQSYGAIVTVTDIPHAIYQSNEIDLNSDGITEFGHGFQFVGSHCVGCPTTTRWVLVSEDHVEWLYDDEGSITLLGEGTIINALTPGGNWSQGFMNNRIYASATHIPGGVWSDPFGGNQVAHLAFRFEVDSEWHYGFVELDLFQNEIELVPGELTTLDTPGFPALQIVAASFETLSNEGIMVQTIPEPSVGMFGMLALMISGITKRQRCGK